MTLYIGVYDTTAAAQEAAAKLAEAGLSEHRALAPGEEETAARSAADAGVLPRGEVPACIRMLQEGKSLVVVKAPYGRGLRTIQILQDSGGTVTGRTRVSAERAPAPLSDALGIPTLAEFKPLTELTSSSWTLSSLYDLPLLSHEPAPLSSRFRWRTLATPKRPWQRSFGLSLLMRNPAPLSSQFRWPTLSAPKRPWQRSFGLPLLYRNPAPLSSLFGIPTLTNGS